PTTSSLIPYTTLFRSDALVDLDGMVGGGFRYHVPVAVPLEHKRVGEMIRALEDRLRLGVVALAVHFDQRDACLALPVQELLDEKDRKSTRLNSSHQII